MRNLHRDLTKKDHESVSLAGACSGIKALRPEARRVDDAGAVARRPYHEQALFRFGWVTDNNNVAQIERRYSAHTGVPAAANKEQGREHEEDCRPFDAVVGDDESSEILQKKQ